MCIRRSDQKHIANNPKWGTVQLAAQHEKLKSEYGYFADDFMGNMQARHKERDARKELQRGEQGAIDPKLSFSKEKALPAAIPLPGQYGVWLGTYASYAGVSISQGEVATQSSPMFLWRKETPLPASIGSAAREQRPGSAVPTRDAGVISVVPMPGTKNGCLGQGNRIKDKLEQSREKKRKN